MNEKCYSKQIFYCGTEFPRIKTNREYALDLLDRVRGDLAEMYVSDAILELIDEYVEKEINPNV